MMSHTKMRGSAGLQLRLVLALIAVISRSSTASAQVLTWTGPTNGSQNLTTTPIAIFTTPGTYTVTVDTGLVMTFEGVAGGAGGGNGGYSTVNGGGGGGAGATTTGTTMSL